MAYKDKIYDITALEMFKRLEVFLDKKLGPEKVKKEKWTVDRKIGEFAKKGARHASAGDRKKDPMHLLRNTRNDIVHPYAWSATGEFRPHPEPVLNLARFRNFQEICYKLEDDYHELRMKEIMIPTLKYEMGNAGDIVKHGVLAEFVSWYAEAHKNLRVADTFAGCPWGNLPSVDDSSGGVVRRRLLALNKTALGGAYFPMSGVDKYWGSSHLVRRIAEKREMSARIEMSDRNEDARCNLGNSVLGRKGMELIELPKGNDGYQILHNGHPSRYDLILIDPYSEFLRDEFYWGTPRHFPVIRELVAAKEHRNLFIAVFVLDKNRDNSVGKAFHEFKKKHLADIAFSLRCPKFCEKEKGIVKGESVCDSEMLLIGRQIADGECSGLYNALRRFAEQAAKALPLSEGKELELWGAGQEGTPDEPERFSRG